MGNVTELCGIEDLNASTLAVCQQHFCVGCPSLKKARGPLLRRMEQAHPGFAILKDNDKFVRIVQQANLDSHIAKLLYIIINRGVH